MRFTFVCFNGGATGVGNRLGKEGLLAILEITALGVAVFAVTAE